MITNSTKVLAKAKKEKYAIPHFNVLDANFIKNIIEECESLKTPVFLAISKKSIEYMGGFTTFSETIKTIDKNLKITIPIIIHLDHGSYDDCKMAINSGFTSVMFDGSQLSFKENLEKSKKLVDLASQKNISVEVEVGSIGGEEDGVIGRGEKSSIQECIQMNKIKISSLAIGINTIHGAYPSNWEGIDWELLQRIKNETNTPLVMHGGSGIPHDVIKKTINMGISKFNVGTALQKSFGEGVRKYFLNQEINHIKKWYDPRKIVDNGMSLVRNEVRKIVNLLGSKGKV